MIKIQETIMIMLVFVSIIVGYLIMLDKREERIISSIKEYSKDDTCTKFVTNNVVYICENELFFDIDGSDYNDLYLDVNKFIKKEDISKVLITKHEYISKGLFSGDTKVISDVIKIYGKNGEIFKNIKINDSLLFDSFIQIFKNKKYSFEKE